MAKSEQTMLYIKVGDDFIPYDESSFWSITLTNPERTQTIRGKLMTEAAESIESQILERKVGKPAGRAAK